MRARVQLCAASADFWYRHLKPALLLTDAEAAAHGPLAALAADDPRLPPLLRDLRALEPPAEPANVVALAALNADAVAAVQLVHRW